MPRKPTRNASAAAIRRTHRNVREEFSYAVGDMPLFDKMLLAEVLNYYASEVRRAGEAGIATAFEKVLASHDLIVLQASEYHKLIEAEKLCRKIRILPQREDVA